METGRHASVGAWIWHLHFKQKRIEGCFSYPSHYVMPPAPIPAGAEHAPPFDALGNFCPTSGSALQRQVGFLVEIYDGWLQIQPFLVSEQLLCLATEYVYSR